MALERSRELSNGYIMVSANGGLNQQRVAVSINQTNYYIFDSSRKYVCMVIFSFLQICNAVAVAALLNATLVLPRFLYSNVWKDPRYFKLLKISKFIKNKIVC